MSATDNPQAAASACSKLVANLNQIETSSCPLDYRQQYALLVASLSDVRDILEVLSERPELNEKLNEAISKCSDEGSRLNDITGTYGVRIEPLDE